eukprot:TRINITY_DN911_c1_g4_i1.p1 TRINITY_DN911_c1_g4~~TRINITY_DN911_c1_g4_i1.p1  ORF type:complete len:295 (+),score=-36.79 TRINITY_DN911_c1_g4_i1:40-924(+)
MQSTHCSSAMQIRFLFLLYHQSYFPLQITVLIKDVLSSSVLSIRFFCNANPISYAPLSPILLFPMSINDTVKHTKAQFSQRIILLQCKSDFFCSFTANFISSYERQNSYHRNKHIPRYSVVSVLFFCNASPIIFAPSSPMSFPPINYNNNLNPNTYRGTAQSMHYYFATQVQFPLLLRIQPYLLLFIVVFLYSKRRTEMQRSQCIILLQCKSNFLYSLIFNLALPQKKFEQCQHEKSYQESIQLINHLLLWILRDESCYFLQRLPQFITKFTNDKFFYLCTLVYEVYGSFNILY